MSQKKYQKMDHIDHVLLRPDTYVGSTRERTIEEYIAIQPETGTFMIQKQSITYSPAILRIFVEILSNVVDNAERSRKTKTPCTKIDINIDPETGKTSVWNDGDIIPIEINSDEGCYNHTLIFGHLLTSSNYDDEEERLVSGRNGYGAKVCNIFSSEFRISGLDPKNKKILVQTWTKNMKTTTPPIIEKITDKKLKTGYTEICWVPDFSQFGIEGYTDDIIGLYTKYVIDAAMLSRVPTYLNGVQIPVNSLTDYARLYKSPTDETLLIKGKNYEVLVATSTEFQVHSFVNGVYTKLGGCHVDSWVEGIFRPIVNKFNKKDKPQITIRDVKAFFRLFINISVVNPEFDGQDKSRLEAPAVQAEVKASHIHTICGWSVGSQIEDMIRLKELVVLKKVETKKKGGYTKIEGLDPANNSGTKFSRDCTLIICEGLSAKTYAVAGIEKGVYGRSGRDWFGIYPIRGKLVNVRNKAATAVAKNKEITDLIQALGIRHGIDYTIDSNYNSLKYGRVMIMTDADVDGIHIEGLVMNFFHSMFPTVFGRETPFLVSMKTPIVRVFRPRLGDLVFFDERKFREYQVKCGDTGKINNKYYKGLGSWESDDIPDTFGVKMIEFISDENATLSMIKAFHKSNSDDRKEWLSEYTTDRDVSLDEVGDVYQMSMTDFVDGELIKFSINDCKRSIPALLDGFKESQRKILYSAKKRKLWYSGKTLKVAQFAGYIAENTNYHHGEVNLYDTITRLAHEFPGSNNIPLLYRDGQFGSRLQGGKDAANGRYICTKLDRLTNLIFRPEDDPLLESNIDDGDIVEPKFYVPIIPMILVNGCTAGIGTGWSCTIPCYNPLDLIECIKIWLSNAGNTMTGNISLYPELTPWYRGFRGEIVPAKGGKFTTFGICEPGAKNTTIVSELPVGLWTEKFKEHLEDLITDKQIKDIKNYSTPSKVNFIIVPEKDRESLGIDELKLYTTLHTTNMVLFDTEEKLHKYTSVDEIINDFCSIRFKYYTKRKQTCLDSLEYEARLLGNKERFVREVIDGTIVVLHVKESDIVKILEERGYTKSGDISQEDPDQSTGNYDYLLRMPIRTFTVEKVEKLCDDIASKHREIENIKSLSEKDMWLQDLAEFQAEYLKFIEDMDKTRAKTSKSTAKNTTKKSKK